MHKKDIAELKKRLTKNGCSFTKMIGCYVDADKNRVVDINETFLNLDEEEMHKYLEIAKKTLSGTVHNNLLSLEFPREEEAQGGKQQFLMGVRESKLKNPEIANLFFDRIIETYDYPGNYLILLFHDAYDVMTKTSDNQKLDESEEVYEYILCAICPVTLSKAALGYREDQHRIGARIRDWVVGAPESGFVFPAFSERSSDIHSVIFYTRNAKEPHNELAEEFLGCNPKKTATMQKNAFENLVQQAMDTHPEASEATLMDIQSELQEMMEEQAAQEDESELILHPSLLKSVMEENEVPASLAKTIEEAYEEEFAEEPPVVDSLIDKKTMEANAKRRQQQALTKEIEALKQTIEEKNTTIAEKDAVIEQKDLDIQSARIESGSTEMVAGEGEILLQVNEETAEQITSQIIDGRTCIVIPLEGDEHVLINGETFDE
ncbi:MAG: DUF4317 domain-containing protein [Lachnospiraceae bacterium]|nr:DUF4317 domain-containing protein [Lachnospiraceae bacterium]